MTIKPSRTAAELWLLELERERHDQSYKIKTIPYRHQPDTAPQPKKINANDQKKRDNVMFHAGRYSEGARDASAVTANAEISKYLKGK
jgi:hypothetical protein